MISSEVQRTLVKSPPELWTELSDPESLARHLGELGEITITRTEPENLVEWEAEGTTGTVEIESSGWGTRVKLTVLRELEAEPGGEGQAAPEASAAVPSREDEPETPALEAALEEEPEAPAAAPALAEELATATSTPTLEEELQAVAPAPPATGEEAAVADVSTTAGPEPTAETPPRELKPAPATEAARRAAGWPPARQETGPAIESDLRAAEEVDGPPREPDGLQEWAAQSAEADAAAVTATPADGEPDAPEPRRGFFARIFGRRRARRAEAEHAGPAAIELDVATPPALCEPDGVLEQGVPADEPEPEQALDLELAPEHAFQDGAPAEQGAGEEPESEPLDAAPEDHQTTTAGPDLAAAGEESAVPDAPEVVPVEDLAAELRAAEEVAAEQVEAVLTAVLDRLGSAHHRPFSRS